MPIGEILSLGNKLRRLKEENIDMHCIYWEYTGIDGQSFVVTNVEENKKIFD